MRYTCHNYSLCELFFVVHLNHQTKFFHFEQLGMFICAILWSFIDMPSECYINARHVMANVIDGKQHNCILHTLYKTKNRKMMMMMMMREGGVIGTKRVEVGVGIKFYQLHCIICQQFN